MYIVKREAAVTRLTILVIHDDPGIFPPIVAKTQTGTRYQMLHDQLGGFNIQKLLKRIDRRIEQVCGRGRGGVSLEMSPPEDIIVTDFHRRCLKKMSLLAICCMVAPKHTHTREYDKKKKSNHRR